jgi:hypothetical protein
MLNRLNALLGHSMHASDGPIGVLEDFYFDDSQWVMRYLVVDVGRFLHRRKVLISPVAILGIDAATETVSLKHSMDQVKNSPDIDVDKPVYRQLEEQLVNYYGWVAHWTPQHGVPEPQPQPVPTGDTHLRSMNNVCKYTVMAFDGRVGTIADFVLDDNGWRLPLVVLDTSHYVSAGLVVIPAARFKGIRVEDEEISVNLSKAEVEKAARLDPARPLEEYATTLL